MVKSDSTCGNDIWKVVLFPWMMSKENGSIFPLRLDGYGEPVQHLNVDVPL